MQPKRSAVIASSVALVASGAVPPVSAACANTAESTHTVIRGQFVRCEDASFYLQAGGAYQQYEQDLEVAIERIGEDNREELMRRLQSSSSFPLDPDFEARIVVVAIDWRATIVPWMPGTSTAVEFKDQPREIRETLRYWWRGSVEVCEQLVPWAPIDLWVHAECCDTFEFPAPVCIIQMDYAEFAPAAMSEALSRAAEGA